MRVQIQVQGDSDSADLLRWLRNDPVSAHTTFSTPSAVPDEAHMGAVEIIQAVVDNSTALGGLVIATAAWRDARRNSRAAETQTQVKIERNGIAVTVLNGDPAEVQRIVTSLSQAEHPNGGANTTAS